MANEKPRAIADDIPVWCGYDAIVQCAGLKPNPQNPNTHPNGQIELLAKIIKEQGWRLPITVSKRSGMIVKGHGRLLAAMRGGLSEAPVDYQDYTSEDLEQADLIADNKLAELAETDKKTLQDLVQGMSEDVLGFTALSDDELSNIFNGREPDAEKPEVEFTQELLLEHNYVVLYFDNSFDWHVAIEKFGLKKVKDLIPRKSQPTGIGRVLNGAEWLERINQ